MAEEDLNARCVDDITGKELPWTAVLRAREDPFSIFGKYEEVDERTAIAKFGVTTPVDTKWIDTDKAFEGGACADKVTNYCTRMQERRRARCAGRNTCAEGTEGHWQTLGIMHIDVSYVYFLTEAETPVLVLPVEDLNKNGSGQIGLSKKSMYDTRDAARNWEFGWQNHLKRYDYTLGKSSKKLVPPQEQRHIRDDARRRRRGHRSNIQTR